MYLFFKNVHAKSQAVQELAVCNKGTVDEVVVETDSPWSTVPDLFCITKVLHEQEKFLVRNCLKIFEVEEDVESVIDVGMDITWNTMVSLMVHNQPQNETNLVDEPRSQAFLILDDDESFLVDGVEKHITILKNVKHYTVGGDQLETQ